MKWNESDDGLVMMGALVGFRVAVHSHLLKLELFSQKSTGETQTGVAEMKAAGGGNGFPARLVCKQVAFIENGREEEIFCARWILIDCKSKKDKKKRKRKRFCVGQRYPKEICPKSIYIEKI